MKKTKPSINDPTNNWVKSETPNRIIDLKLESETTPEASVPEQTKTQAVDRGEVAAVAGNFGEKPEAADKNDNRVDLDKLVKDINAFHANAAKSEEEALRNAWEAGVRLNQAFGSVKYGGWGKFLKKNCPDLGLTTVWRYRRLDDGYSTVEELAGVTLSEAYAKLGLTNFEEEPTGNRAARTGAGAGGTKNDKSPIAKLLKDVAKASVKFDEPTSLNKRDISAVEKLCLKLEEVHGQSKAPSILGVRWQTKIKQDPDNWEDEEIHLFREDFEKLRVVYEKLPIAEGA
jgi:hypothetical protein